MQADPQAFRWDIGKILRFWASGLLGEWALFDEIPKEANLSSENVHMLSYNGQFYLTVEKIYGSKEDGARNNITNQDRKICWMRSGGTPSIDIM